MKKLNEITPSYSVEVPGFHPLAPLGQYITNPKKEIQDKSHNLTTTFKYGGYDFIIDKRNNEFFMLLPNKNFIVGNISFSIIDNYEDISIQEIPQIQGSVIHERFRNNGLGKIMYQAFAKHFKVIASDYSLGKKAYKMWSYFITQKGGYLGVYNEDSWDNKLFIIKPFKNIYGIKYQKIVEDASFFVYYSNKKLIPDNAIFTK